MEIPKGNSREEVRARRQIIKDYYAKWIAKHPDKKVWNPSLCAFIHIKFCSINETSGRAALSYESTSQVFNLSAILASAKLTKRMPPKKGDKNQSVYSEILILKTPSAILVVGKHKNSGEYIQYCISGKYKKNKSR